MIDIMKHIPVGLDNAISQEELSERIECDKRTTRQLVFNARKNGKIICSVCDGANGGYYIPSNIDEIIPYIRMQKARINSAEIALRSAEQFVEGGSKDE